MQLHNASEIRPHSWLSQLGKTADGLRPAYLKLAITHGTDMSSCRELAGYPDLQILMLANNELRDLSHLSYLPNLIHLDVANNKLTEMRRCRRIPDEVQSGRKLKQQWTHLGSERCDHMNGTGSPEL
eukprot:scaffold89072_cov23-Tisochrysis_lutea.AAC.1